MENKNLKPLNNKKDKVIMLADENNEIYYFKKESNWFVELISDEVARVLGLTVVAHQFYRRDGHIGLISKSSKKKGYRYINGVKLMEDFLKNNPKFAKFYFKLDFANNLETIWWALEDRYKNNPTKSEIIEKIMNQFLDLYEFTIITAQNDIHLENYQIEENELTASLTAIFDNLNSFINNPMAALTMDNSDMRSDVYYSLKNILI